MPLSCLSMPLLEINFKSQKETKTIQKSLGIYISWTLILSQTFNLNKIIDDLTIVALLSKGLDLSYIAFMKGVGSSKKNSRLPEERRDQERRFKRKRGNNYFAALSYHSILKLLGLIKRNKSKRYFFIWHGRLWHIVGFVSTCLKSMKLSYWIFSKS